MSELVRLVKFIDGATPQWRQLSDLVREVLPAYVPIVAEETERRLRSVVSLVPRAVSQQVVRHDLLRPYSSYLPADPGSAIEVYVRLRTQPDLFPLLGFLEVLSHHLEGDAAAELQRMIDDLALRSDLTTRVRALRGLIQAAPTMPDPPSGELKEGLETDDDDTIGGDVRSPGLKSDPGTRLAPVPPQVWGGVPPRNSNFTGRSDLLGRINEALREHTPSALVPQPLFGLGGIGKSQLAVEFAYRNQYDYELLWWVQADDEQSIRRSLASLARRLRLAESEDVQEIVDGVLDALRVGNPHKNWLLIYDNAPEPSVVQRYLPSGPGHVLVTSRSRSWSGLSNSIEVDVFTPQESEALLRGRWPDLSEEQALTLAEELGHLPLALEQAVAVHQQTGMPLDDYLRALKNSPKLILDEGTPADYPRTVAAALSLAYESVKKVSPAAAQLLLLCSFLSSHPISIPLLARGRSALPIAELRDDILLRRAIRDLGRYALVQLDSGRDSIRVHSLIRAVLRDSLSVEERTAEQQVAHAVLAAANPGFPDDPGSWEQHGQISSHVVPSGLVHSQSPEVRRVVVDQIRYFFAIGDYATSVRIGRETVELWRENVVENDEFTLVASRHLAVSLRMLGRYEEAWTLNEDTMRRMTEKFGADHEHSMATASSLGADLRLAGRFRQALELDEATLNRQRQVLGERDLNTLRTLNNLAVDYRILGDFGRALELDEENIELKKDIYGADHPVTLFSYSNLMRDLYGLGKFQRGLALAREKVPVYEAKVPLNHGYLLLAKRNMAILLRRAGHHTEAVQYARELHEACRKKFGRHHEHTQSAMVTLSNALRVTGDTATALKYGQDALNFYREVLGPEHAFTLACQTNVAIVLRLLDRNDEAMTLNDAALATFISILGEDHPHSMSAANTKANILASEGRVEEARALGEQTYQRSRRVRGDNHPHTLACAINLSFDLEKLGNLVEANQLRRKTLDQLGVHLGTDHPDTMNAGVYRRMESDVEVPAT
jgi:tetratricopeptide (TPR) repeat protein